jgi:hypothetical protein
VQPTTARGGITPMRLDAGAAWEGVEPREGAVSGGSPGARMPRDGAARGRRCGARARVPASNDAGYPCLTE